MDHVQRILAELSGESRHITFRRALEETARDHLIRLLIHEEYDQISSFYRADVTMVTGLDATLDGEILKGRSEIKKHFMALHEQNEILAIPVLTIADRGRITCYIESWYKWMGKLEAKKEDESSLISVEDEAAEAPYVGWPVTEYGDVLKMREVVVFDLDDGMKVKRVEWRQLGMEQKGKVSLDIQARSSEHLRVLIEGNM